MKTWQMVKELTENPGKRYSCGVGEVTMYGGGIVWAGHGGKLMLGVEVLDDDWKEVKQPVSFMEAVESGKRIRYPDLFEDEEYRNLDDVLTELGSNYYPVEVKDIILNGKFYIED